VKPESLDRARAEAEPASDPQGTIAFQGRPGAYSHLACRQAFPDLSSLPCEAFDDAFAAVREGRARLAMIPIENSLAGRVADIHHLMPHGGLHIVGEHFQRVNHHLLAVPGTSLEDLREVHSHPQALGQCRRMIRALGLRPVAHADTAGAAADVAIAGRRDQAAIASRLAAATYGLEILRSDLEDASHNTTRFVVLARAQAHPVAGEGPVITTFVFRVRNVPAALYKALGGFATNSVNMLKLESYVDSAFTPAQFYADILGHPAEDGVRNAFEELRFFSDAVEVLGVYPADPFRFRAG
jgi:prephenate dehydratase